MSSLAFLSSLLYFMLHLRSAFSTLVSSCLCHTDPLPVKHCSSSVVHQACNEPILRCRCVMYRQVVTCMHLPQLTEMFCGPCAASLPLDLLLPTTSQTTFLTTHRTINSFPESSAAINHIPSPATILLSTRCVPLSVLLPSWQSLEMSLLMLLVREGISIAKIPTDTL